MSSGTGGRRPSALDPDAMFAAIDRWPKLAGRPTPEVEPGSALAGDARKSPQLQVAHAAWSGISHSIDHLSTLRVLLVEAQASFTWRLCSGFAHGRYWASFSFLEREVSASQSGQLNIRLTGDVEKLLEVMRTPFVFTGRSLDLYEQRRRCVLP